MLTHWDPTMGMPDPDEIIKIVKGKVPDAKVTVKNDQFLMFEAPLARGSLLTVSLVFRHSGISYTTTISLQTSGSPTGVELDFFRRARFGVVQYENKTTHHLSQMGYEYKRFLDDLRQLFARAEQTGRVASRWLARTPL